VKKSLQVTFFILLGLLIFLSITQLPRLFETPYKYHLNDEQLRQKALNLNIKSVPSNYEELFEVLNTNSNDLSPQKIALGEQLFNETLLSYNNDISCATCHILKQGGDDNRPTAIGHLQQANPLHLNTPTVLNTALATAYFWDGRAKSLQEQAAGPIQAHFEMNMTPNMLIKRLKNSGYEKAFQNIYNPTHDKNIEALNFRNVLNALATYEKTLFTKAPIDAFLDGDNGAISTEAKKGFELFLTQGCRSCHARTNFGGLSMQRFPLRTWWNEASNLEITFQQNQLLPTFKIVDRTFPFENIGGFKGKDNTRLFRVPILRNIDKTAPYFHNGSVKELKEAVRIMGKYQRGIIFTEQELDYLVAFLKTLNGELVNFNKP
jgi:cytochrome c peroxidase